MNPTHIHLMITHLPIFGSILGALVLLHGIWTRTDQTKIAAYNLFILSSIGGAIAYFTGEEAEETVEGMAGVAEMAIEAHEHFAVFALTGVLILGLVSVIGLIVTLKKSSLANPISMVVLALSLVCFGLVARTGYLGGQIRHTEVSGGAVGGSVGESDGGESEENDD